MTPRPRCSAARGARGGTASRHSHGAPGLGLVSFRLRSVGVWVDLCWLRLSRIETFCVSMQPLLRAGNWFRWARRFLYGSLIMRKIALGGITALALGAALSGTPTAAHATGYGYDYDEPTTVITRRTVIERRVVRPRPVVREIVVERPIVYRPRPIIREVVVERPVVYRPRPVFQDVVVERDGFYGPRPFRRNGFYGPRSFRPAPDRFGYDGPAFDPYD